MKKKMTRRNWMWALAALFVFTACDKDDNLDEQTGSDSLEENVINAEITVSGNIGGHDYVDLGLNVKWATCNIGADQPEKLGNLYAWGEVSTKSSYTSANSLTNGKQMPSSIAGNSQYDAATANWGSSWRMPTRADMQLLMSCTWTWAQRNGVTGYLVTGKNGNTLFLPGGIMGDDSGFYWSAVSMPDNVIFSTCLCFDYSLSMLDVADNTSRFHGFPIRAVVK